MAVFLGSMSRVQSQSALGEVSSLQSQRAWAIARSAMYWAVAESQGSGCSMVKNFTLEQFNVVVSCENHGYEGTDDVAFKDGSDPHRAYVLEVTVSSAPPLTPGEPGYAKRRLRTSVVWEGV